MIYLLNYQLKINDSYSCFYSNEGLEHKSTDEVKSRLQIDRNKQLVIKGIFRKNECHIIARSELEMIQSIEQNLGEKTAGNRVVKIEL